VASVSSVSYTGIADIDGVLSGIRWTDPRLTFSFAASGVSIGSAIGANIQTLSTTQQDAIRSILKMAASISGLSFTEVADTRTSQGTMRFGESATEVTASGYYPSTASSGGDAWFNLTDYNSPRPGSYAFMTMLHETGHTLGLDHGHDGAYALPPDHDSIEYSVMTYRSYAGGGTGAYTARDGSYPRSFMLSDLAALQYMYGANYGTNAGDTTYRWSPTTGELAINGAGQGTAVTNTILETIWDGGGIDTYDLSNYTVATNINLRPGEWSMFDPVQRANLGDGRYARGEVANALMFEGNTDSLIENAIGGLGVDSFTANQVANQFRGNGGADIFRWASTGDAGTGPLADTILDFESGFGKDKIDFRDLDANPATAAHDAFSFIGTSAFHNVAGEVRYDVTGGNAHIFADVDGNGTADMKIEVDDSVDLTATNFVL